MKRRPGLLQIAAAVKNGKLEIEKLPLGIRGKVKNLTSTMTKEQLDAYAYPERPENFRTYVPEATSRKARTA